MRKWLDIMNESDDSMKVFKPKDLEKAISKAWSEVYPKMPIRVLSDDGEVIQVTSDKKKYRIHGGNGDHFYLSFSAQYYPADDDDPAQVHIMVTDAYANLFTGAVTKILAAVYKRMNKKYPDAKRILVIEDNRNPAAWYKISQKLGAQIQENNLFGY